MYGCNNTCLKFKKICFAKFTDSVKITSQSIKMASQFDGEQMLLTQNFMSHFFLDIN